MSGSTSATTKFASLGTDETGLEGEPRERKTEPMEPSGRVVRSARPAEKGLLIVYPLLPVSDELRRAGAANGLELSTASLVGFAVSFPESPDAPAMDYVVNRQFLSELLGEDEENSPRDLQ